MPDTLQAAGSADLTLRLAAAAVATRAAALPPDLLRIARQCLLDIVGVGIAGAGEPLSRMLAAEALQEGGRPDAGLLGRPERLPRRAAALVNGATAHALDYDDYALVLQGHASVTIYPAALALAESLGRSGDELFAAFVAGYEAQARISAGFGFAHYDAGFHATGTLGTLGAAVACAHLLRLDAATTAAAIGIAATQAAGLKVMFGTMCKPLHAGKAAENGLTAALLAARGFTSRPDALERPGGFAATHSPFFDPALALAEPPGGFHLRANLFKFHAACFDTHPAIENVRRLQAEPGFDLAAVRRVTVKVDRGDDSVCNIARPSSGLECKFSLRMTTAMALAGVDTARLESFSDAAAVDPRLVQLRDLVEVDCSATLPQSYAETAIHLADGRVLQARHDSTVPAQDLAGQERRLAAKFRGLVAPCLGEAGAAELAATILALDARPVADLAGIASRHLAAEGDRS